MAATRGSQTLANKFLRGEITKHFRITRPNAAHQRSDPSSGPHPQYSRPDICRFTQHSDGIRNTLVFLEFRSLPNLLALSIDCPTTRTHNTTEVLDYSNTDINALIQTLSKIDWDSITDRDVDEATEAFTATLLEAAYRCIPTKIIRIRQSKLWVTADLRRQIRKRNRLFRQACSRQTEYDWARWRTQRNLVTSINRKLKREHIQQKVNILLSCRKDPLPQHNKKHHRIEARDIHTSTH